jgi:hypothetical protein
VGEATWNAAERRLTRNLIQIEETIANWPGGLENCPLADLTGLVMQRYQMLLVTLTFMQTHAQRPVWGSCFRFSSFHCKC